MITPENYPIPEYVEILNQALEPHRRVFATEGAARVLMKAQLTPGHGRGFVEQAYLMACRDELRSMVGKVPALEVAQKEAELNALADQMARRGLLS